MAQTKRKRRTKHRGTAAGTVTARGRTGRKPTAQETAPARGGDTRARRQARYQKPPSWRSAFQRSALVTVFFVLFIVVFLKGTVAGTLVLIPFVLLLYAFLGYYTDLYLHRRYLKRRAEQGGGGA